MTQPGGRQLAHVWAAMTSAFASAAAEVRAEGHLATDAIVAYVDGELSLCAHERATRHLAHCPMCTAEVAAQRQAATAVRDADAPVVPKSLLAALHDIPQNAPLPAGPDGLAMTDDGQLVVVQRSDGRLGSRPPLGSGAPFGSTRRLGSAGIDASPAGTRSAAEITSNGGRRLTGRLAQGAGVVVSGLVLGVLVLAAPTEAPDNPAGPGSPRPNGVGGAPVPVNAELAPAPDRRSGATPAAPRQPVLSGMRAR